MYSNQVQTARKKDATARATIPATCNILDLPLVDFFLFAKLPTELQDMIWNETCFNESQILDAFIRGTEFFFTSLSGKIPSVLHTTYGSRDIALQRFTLIQHARLELNPTTPQTQQLNPLGQNAIQALNIAAGAFPGGFPPGWNLLVAAANNQTRRAENVPTWDILTQTRPVYVNFRCDILKLQVGETPGVAYPTFALEADHLGVPSRKLRDFEISKLLTEVFLEWRNPGPFPVRAKNLPRFFGTVTQLVLPFHIRPPFTAHQPQSFTIWAKREVPAFLVNTVEPVLAHFPAMRHLGLFVEGGKRLQGDRLLLRDCRQIRTLRANDGISLSRIELKFLEYEVRHWFSTKFSGENGALSQYEVRLVGWLPERCEVRESAVEKGDKSDSEVKSLMDGFDDDDDCDDSSNDSILGSCEE